ncbi:hypothetical protein EJ02DRAFT_102704 [Clathrospora elynae]|uniref:Winged helix-turn helix domain-containing protein n=1 Tax=Clathrospora elynae TaxID=706981 RepID=A0A6A5S8E1_9PLEO|nr:hypothetical protein EJ02DRAFT_102704 [Clathrospora elynae]
MVEFLVDEFAVEVSDCTVYQTLKRARWTRKVAPKHAKACSEALREVFFAVTTSLTTSLNGNRRQYLPRNIHSCAVITYNPQ